MKNIKMLVIAVLLVAVAVTSYAVSGTYAKYTTTKNLGSDSARVAKWVINDINTVDLFNSDYTAVNGNGDTKVVAPGTSGTYTFQITGDVETNYTLLVEVTGNDSINTNDYKPMSYTLDGNSYATIEALAAAIEGLYNGSQVYAAGTVSESQHTIGWSWAYSVGADEDTKDTTLGNSHTGEVSLGIVITAVQSEQAAN